MRNKEALEALNKMERNLMADCDKNGKARFYPYIEQLEEIRAALQADQPHETDGMDSDDLRHWVLKKSDEEELKGHDIKADQPQTVDDDITELFNMTDEEIMACAVKEYGSEEAALKEADRMKLSIQGLIKAFDAGKRSAQGHGKPSVDVEAIKREAVSFWKKYENGDTDNIKALIDHLAANGHVRGEV